jgi:hypothetical protein
VGTSGKDWVFQPHRNLYKMLARNVLEHYDSYKQNQVDKTYVPAYFYLGGAGTGKSRHASEFAHSVQEAIELDTKHPFYHDLTQRLKNPFVFHVSFENGTSLTAEEMDDPWNAIGIRMLQQLLRKPLRHVRKQFLADPADIFQLVAAAANVDLYEDFTGILVVDGVQNILKTYNDGREKQSAFYVLLNQIGGLGMMSRHPSETEDGALRAAPFIMTCVTATYFGPVEEFLAESHRKRIFLPLNQIQPPTWKDGNSLVLSDSPLTRLLVKDVGGYARAVELIADELAKKPEQNIAEFANNLQTQLEIRYREALSVLRDCTLPIVECILSRQQIRLRENIPGSTRRWEDVTSTGLTWFERAESFDTSGYLVAPYIWLWMLARLQASEGTEHLRKFLVDWQFNDYAELLCLKTGKGQVGNTTWQSFERFCCSFRILRSLGFGDEQEMSLKSLHSGCKLQDDRKTKVVNRHLKFAEAVRQCGTNSMVKKRVGISRARSPDEVETKHSGTLDTEAQLSHVILNAASAPAGDFFLSIEIPTPRASNGRDGRGKTVHEVGQCKLIEKKLTQAIYDAEREKSAGSDDIFILYTQTEVPNDLVLPDRSGLVDKSCWNSYFGPFSGRAYIASQYSISRLKNELPT